MNSSETEGGTTFHQDISFLFGGHLGELLLEADEAGHLVRSHEGSCSLQHRYVFSSGAQATSSSSGFARVDAQLRNSVMISILLIWAMGIGYLRVRYARRYGGDNPLAALAWGYLFGGPKEGRALRRFIWAWAIFWPLLFFALALTVFQEGP